MIDKFKEDGFFGPVKFLDEQEISEYKTHLLNAVDNLNLMSYVGIHEMSHIMSIEVGHGDEFISNFEFLLNYAKELKYLDPFTKSYQPVYIQLSKLNTADNYCGVPLVNSIN